MPDSMNPTKPPQLLKPEGSRKIVVLNGSRQIDQVIKGEWTTLKVLPENGLPRGIYQLSEAKEPDLGEDGKPKDYEGQLLHIDKRSVFQLCGGKIIEHDRGAFDPLDTSDRPLTVGCSYGVTYLNGRPIGGGEVDVKSASKQQVQTSTKKKDQGHSL